MLPVQKAHVMEGDNGSRISEHDFAFIKNNAISVVGELRRKSRKTLSIGLGESIKLKQVPIDDTDSMQRSMSIVFRVAQCFALCPVQGITSHHAKDLRFIWRSFLVMYSLLMAIAMFYCNIIVFIWIIDVSLNFKTTSVFVFYINGFLCNVLFLRTAKNWPEISRIWQEIERSQLQYGYPKNLHLKIRIITALILIIAFFENILSHLSSIYIAKECSLGDWDVVKRYFVIFYRNTFQVLTFSPLASIFAAVFHFFAAFYWNFTDLFIITISIALSSRFKLINNHLRRVRGKDETEIFWKEMRENYESLCSLTRTLDNSISGIVLLSFATDVFFIIQQLLYSANHITNDVHKTYVIVSFTYLTIRTLMKLLCAARINDESQVPRTILYSVPSTSYNIETRRFLNQVLTDKVALTGQNFFPVTRTVLLTLTGTIVTYEIVLVQFGAAAAEGVTANLTELCLNITRVLET